MRISHVNAIGALLLLVAGGCMGGTGSGMLGISSGGNDGGSNAPPVLSFFVQPNSANAGRIITPPVQVLE